MEASGDPGALPQQGGHPEGANALDDRLVARLSGESMAGAAGVSKHTLNSSPDFGRPDDRGAHGPLQRDR
jgi:hypothetical protein